METSCCICWRRCVCLIRQCPSVRIRLFKIQIHNLTCSKIVEFFIKIATVIPLQPSPISGFRGDSSFPIAIDFWRFLFSVQYKPFIECSLILFRCLLLRVLFYIVQFQDSPAIPLFRIAIVKGFLAIPLLISIKISVVQCALFQCICLLLRFLFNFEYFSISRRLLFSRCDRLWISGDSSFEVYQKLSSDVLYFLKDFPTVSPLQLFTFRAIPLFALQSFRKYWRFLF